MQRIPKHARVRTSLTAALPDQHFEFDHRFCFIKHSRKLENKTQMVSIFRRFLESIRKNTSDQLEVKYKGFSIFLPAEHKLPEYQQRHVKYDQFLPHLAKYMEDLSTVIDVGANCGDTLAGMCQENDRLKYICIEPDDTFFEYLNINICLIKDALKGLDVTAVKSLVGQSISNVSLKGVGGTRHAVVGAGNTKSDSLDSILDDLSPTQVKLLKTDVDGFDWDVIDSSRHLLSSSQPMVFFECQFEDEYQKAKFKETISWLKENGYEDWTVFDNFGEVMARTQNIEIIFQLMEYVWRQNQKVATRTIYYYDILAASSQDSQLIDAALKEY